MTKSLLNVNDVRKIESEIANTNNTYLIYIFEKDFESITAIVKELPTTQTIMQHGVKIAVAHINASRTSCHGNGIVLGYGSVVLKEVLAFTTVESIVTILKLID